MKVKFFSGTDVRFENKVNDFIATHKVIDIKFSSCDDSFDVMILYDDKDE